MNYNQSEPEKYKFCCNQLLLDEYTYCPYCGEKLKDEPETEYIVTNVDVKKKTITLKSK